MDWLELCWLELCQTAVGGMCSNNNKEESMAFPLYEAKKMALLGGACGGNKPNINQSERFICKSNKPINQ